MTLIPRCSQCDAPIDPWGRDGGHSWCKKCLGELNERITGNDGENSDPKAKGARRDVDAGGDKGGDRILETGANVDASGESEKD